MSTRGFKSPDLRQFSSRKLWEILREADNAFANNPPTASIIAEHARRELARRDPTDPQRRWNPPH